MKITKSLALVGEVELDGVTAHIHATPISSAVFEQYFEPMSVAFANLHKRGLQGLGPKIAYLMLKKAAEQLGEWNQINSGLLTEVRRLTNILLPDPSGWKQIPYQSAIAQKLVSAEDQAEIDGAVVFFTLSFAVMGRKEVMAILPALTGWSLQLESLTLMEYADLLPTLTEAGSSTSQANI